MSSFTDWKNRKKINKKILTVKLDYLYLINYKKLFFYLIVYL